MRTIFEGARMKTKRWKPKFTEIYYSIEILQSWSHIVTDAWTDLPIDMRQYESGNCFRTKKEAQQKLKQIKKILKER